MDTVWGFWNGSMVLQEESFETEIYGLVDT